MEVIIQPVASVLVRTLLILAQDEIIFLIGIPEEIERLRARMERILPILADADIWRMQSNNIDVWVKQIRDVVYDAEDIIEECRIEAEKFGSTKNQCSSSSSSSSPLLSFSVSCCFYPFSSFGHYGVLHHRIGNQIKSLNQKLDDILKDMAIINLRSTHLTRDTESRISRETSPLVEPDLIGERIGEDSKMLVDLLLSKEQHFQQKICVFAIVGMGGIGKTTLAQKIYNDDRLQAEFYHPPPIWICVSKDFSETDLLRAIIMHAEGNPGEVKDKKILEPMLHEVVKDKRIFLVLDDVWDAQVWERLLYKPLQSCSAGSRVLLTTRNETVARCMGTMYCHRVEKLSDEDGWSLLSKMVFLDGRDAVDMQNTFRDIGIRIVKKCGGLPLALKTIAGVLRNKEKRQRDWEKVLKNPAWSFTELPEGVLGALYLSYTELPSSLKRCFLYFALFPEDAELFRGRFVCLWIAEGFVEAKENILSEELAEEYWKELVNRSFLEPQSYGFDSDPCKMHDLLHSLARHLASDECFCGDIEEFSENFMSCSARPMKVRRMHINDRKEPILGGFVDHGSSRTLLSPSLENFTKHAVAKFKCLRILDIRESPVTNLPNSVGDLVHLKYLCISRTAIRKIPESIGNLRNLQFLIMDDCKNLDYLPSSITNLFNLRWLCVMDTGLHSMPVGILKLKNLVQLHGFLVFRQSGRRHCNIEELGSLTQLMGLTVSKLDSTSSRENARAAALKAKHKLTYLEMQCTPCKSDVEPNEYYRKEEIEKIGEVFEELCPPLCLEELRFAGYFGPKYPSWMMKMPSSFIPNLRMLVLTNCVVCEQLPPLGLLPQLERLTIEGASAVKSIGPEFFGLDCSKANAGGREAAVHPGSYFPKLDLLEFINMPNWTEWSWLKEEDKVEDHLPPKLLPCLYTVLFQGCPKLRLLPEGVLCHATSLTELKIEDALYPIQVKNLLHLEQLILASCPIIERVSNLPALKRLQITDCGKLKHVDGVDALQLLILKDPEMESLPEWFLNEERPKELQFPKLRKLHIRGSIQLLTRCMVHGPDWDKIQHILLVDAYTYYLPNYYINYTKSPFSFVTNLTSHNYNDNSEEGASSST